MILCILSLGGLCNRMRTMSSVLDLSERLNQKAIFVWVKMPDINASFDHLFVHFPATVISLKARGCVFKIIDFIKKHWKGIIIDDSFANKYCKSNLSSNFHLFKNKSILVHSCENLTKTEDFSMFHPKLRGTFECDNCIGIHIRRTDNVQSILHSPTSLFIQRIQKEIDNDPDVRFYLATDDEKEEEFIRNHFPNHILTYSKRSLDRNNPVGIDDALIDLINLSRCKKILGSYYSSFSDTAASWGNIEKEVIKI